MNFTQKQKKKLRGLGHQLHPLVTISDDGLKPTVLDATIEALDAHELIKVRLRSKDREESNIILKELCDKTGASLINTIGFTALLYKRNNVAPKIEI